MHFSGVMMDFIDSKTYQNLETAYKTELMCSSKYLIYGDIARQEGYIEIGNIYDITARNEKEHARIWLRRINEGSLPTTSENLQESIKTESYNASHMYQNFASVAKEEGFDDIASLFSGVANIEYNHLTNFQNQYDNLVSGKLFCNPNETLWICMQCGNILSGPCAPDICPICGFPQGFYRQLYQQTYI